MACGCPSVLQDLPVLHEVAGAGALYVDFADPQAATAALESICTDAALRARLSAAGIGRSGEFSFERLARERVGALLERVGEAKP
jgi:glycosyltransferase involved in cell wall biosynthesis